MTPLAAGGCQPTGRFGNTPGPCRAEKCRSRSYGSLDRFPGGYKLRDRLTSGCSVVPSAPASGCTLAAGPWAGCSALDLL